MPADPLSKEELDKQNTYSQAVKDRLAALLRSGAQAVGGSLLGQGTANDATAQGQDAKRAALERKALGQ